MATADRDQLDVLLAMGLAPAMYGLSGDYETVAPWIDAALVAGVEATPMPGSFEPNLEAIAAARPDLIVDAWAEPSVHADLSQIAPTIQVNAASAADPARPVPRPDARTPARSSPDRTRPGAAIATAAAVG